MAGGGAGGWAMSLTQELTQESGTESGTDTGLVAFDSIPENCRILHFGTSEEAQCVLEQVLNFALFGASFELCIVVCKLATAQMPLRLVALLFSFDC